MRPPNPRTENHKCTVADPVKFRKLLKSHYFLIKLLTFVDFRVFLGVLAFG